MADFILVVRKVLIINILVRGVGTKEEALELYQSGKEGLYYGNEELQKDELVSIEEV